MTLRVRGGRRRFVAGPRSIAAALPEMDRDARRWLVDALAVEYPDQWLALIRELLDIEVDRYLRDPNV